MSSHTTWTRPRIRPSKPYRVPLGNGGSSKAVSSETWTIDSSVASSSCFALHPMRSTATGDLAPCEVCSTAQRVGVVGFPKPPGRIGSGVARRRPRAESSRQACADEDLRLGHAAGGRCRTRAPRHDGTGTHRLVQPRRAGALTAYRTRRLTKAVGPYALVMSKQRRGQEATNRPSRTLYSEYRPWARHCRAAAGTPPHAQGWTSWLASSSFAAMLLSACPRRIFGDSPAGDSVHRRR